MGGCTSKYTLLSNQTKVHNGHLPIHGESVPVKVIDDIYDGDTFEGIYLDENGGIVQEKFRIIGIDTPEIRPRVSDVISEESGSSSLNEEEIRELLNEEKEQAYISRDALEELIMRSSNESRMMIFRSVEKVSREGSLRGEKRRSQLEKYGRRLVSLHTLEDGKCCNCCMKNFDNFHTPPPRPDKLHWRVVSCFHIRKCYSGCTYEYCTPKRGIDAGEWLIHNGYALPYDGGTKVKGVGRRLKRVRRLKRSHTTTR